MKKLKIIFLVILVAIGFGGCEYNFIVPEIVPYTPGGDDDSNGGGDISFVKSVEPIFNNGNNCTACHKTGGIKPDLSTGKAFASITSLINTANPEASKIYSYPAPATSTHTHKKYTAAQAATVLAWIEQGAKNN